MNQDPRSSRDWLLARHASATTALDELRREALPPPPFTWREFLGEVFRPHRRVWRALAVIWIGLIAFHLVVRRPASNDTNHPPPPEAVAAWVAQFRSYETIAQIDRRP